MPCSEERHQLLGHGDPDPDTWRADLTATLTHHPGCPDPNVDTYATAGPDRVHLHATCRTCRAQVNR